MLVDGGIGEAADIALGQGAIPRARTVCPRACRPDREAAVEAFGALPRRRSSSAPTRFTSSTSSSTNLSAPAWSNPRDSTNPLHRSRSHRARGTCSTKPTSTTSSSSSTPSGRTLSPRAARISKTRSAIDAALLVSPHEAKPVAWRMLGRILGTMILILFGVGVVAQVVTVVFRRPPAPPVTTTPSPGAGVSGSRWPVFVRRPAVRRASQSRGDGGSGRVQGLQLETSPALHRGTDGRGVRRGSAGPLVLLRCHQPSGSWAYEGHQGIFSTSPDIGVSIPTAFLDQIIGTAILVMVIMALTSAVNNPPLVIQPVVHRPSGCGHRSLVGEPTPVTRSTRPAISRPGWRRLTVITTRCT